MEKSRLRQILLLITYAILLYFAIYKWEDLRTVLTTGLSIATPFILGACMAFILSIPMDSIEKRLLSGLKSEKLKKLKRPLSLSLTLILLALIIWLVFFLVVPEVGNTFGKIMETLPRYLARVEKLVNDNSQSIASFGESITGMDLDATIQNLMDYGRKFFMSFFSSTFTMIGSVVQAVFNLVVGLVFAAYILFSKEKLGVQARKLLYAFFPEKAAQRAVEIGSLTHKTFANFLTGQCLEAVILGAMFFLTLTVLRMPYALLIGVVISVTALIPIFGAFIGCILGAFLILMVNPMQALVFVIVFLVLQQIEGNLIYPKVVGGSVGLPSMWVLVAVTVGGDLMGIVGMLLFIPLVSVLYALLRDAANRRLERKKVDRGRWS